MKNIGLIIGVGSVGKKHAKTMSEIFDKLFIIDPNDEALLWCKNNLKCSVNLYNKLENAIFENENLNETICVISNWGIDHFDDIIKLIEHGATSFYVEKPFVNSLLKIEKLKKLSKEKNLNIVSGFYLRNSGLYKKIEELSSKYFAGKPSSIDLNGGACCIVTNGIHFLDFAIQVFESNPISTFSIMQSDKINPRSNKLGFYEGTATWQFPESRSMTICFSNKSSIGHTCNIYFPRGLINITQEKVFVYKRDDEEVKNDPRIIRTGEAQKMNILNEWKPEDYLSISKRLLNDLKKDIKKFDIHEETIATSSIIGALISNNNKSLIDLPVHSSDPDFDKDWPIS